MRQSNGYAFLINTSISRSKLKTVALEDLYLLKETQVRCCWVFFLLVVFVFLGGCLLSVFVLLLLLFSFSFDIEQDKLGSYTETEESLLLEANKDGGS